MRWVFKFKGYRAGCCYSISCFATTKQEIETEAEIIIDLKELKQIVEQSKITYEKAFSEVVSHEVIHYILHKEVNYEACDKFDNISMRKFKLAHCDDYLSMITNFFGGFAEIKRTKQKGSDKNAEANI